MSDDRAQRLAMLLQAIESEEMHFSELRTEHKDCMERLQNQAYKLRQEILSGQVSLLDLAEKTAEHINSGALDRNGTTVRAEVIR